MKKKSVNLAIVFTFLGVMLPVIGLASIAMLATSGLVKSVQLRKLAQAGIALDRLNAGQVPTVDEERALRRYIARHPDQAFSRFATEKLVATGYYVQAPSSRVGP